MEKPVAVDVRNSIIVSQGGTSPDELSCAAATVVEDGQASHYPVLGAGGIGSGRQVAASLALGAQGVWTGSIWLGTEEYQNLRSTDTATVPVRIVEIQNWHLDAVDINRFQAVVFATIRVDRGEGRRAVGVLVHPEDVVTVARDDARDLLEPETSNGPYAPWFGVARTRLRCGCRR